MMVRVWHPFQDVETLRRQLNRVFDEADYSLKHRTPGNWTPAIELIDQGNDLVLNAYLPGVIAEQVDIEVTREAVAFSGERKAPDIQPIYSDIHYGSFSRVVQLPVEVQNNKVKAEFNHGVLTLTLPKVEAEQHRIVKINLGQVTESGADTPEG